MHKAEWQTRKKRIDTRLLALSSLWQIIPWHDGLDTSKLTCHAITEFLTEDGPAGCALFVNGVFLGISEAKKVSLNPQNALEQAKRSAQGEVKVQATGMTLTSSSFYATNGEIIWHLDVRADKPASRNISNFHTGAAMEAMVALDLSYAHK